MKKIAVIGATGLLGKPVTKALLAAGFQVTIITRDLEKAKFIFPNTHVIYGDLEDKTSIIEALKGQEEIYLNLQIAHNAKAKDFNPETNGMINLLSAAGINKIQRIAYLSSLIKDYQGQNCCNWWVFKVKQKAVQLLKGGGIPYTIFYPSCFMENLDKGGFMSGNTINIPGKSKVKMHWISGADYGKQVAKSFQILSDESREYVIQGPQAYNINEAVQIFVQNYTIKKVNVSNVPLSALRILGKLSSKMNYFYHIVEALNKCPEKFQAQLSWDELGKPTETIAQYAAKQSVQV